jgi:hypothetical protein
VTSRVAAIQALRRAVDDLDEAAVLDDRVRDRVVGIALAALYRELDAAERAARSGQLSLDDGRAA